ncbi:uncharacterized protein LOC126990801 [Eriocheir sinensis]|uniref:uncharacterized protein LOC126990801 n=1 Tax=Eriocheir sinensis TaxID=95602 RepID=UPI0021C7EFC3|nr:uncharacterized protein LOC126990801 [Eriocheir sinensis]XP_050705394.1 uncharacterized protein LOC126990801 [Eriocheir sinensis]XP_050705402.1 uncharacterized protein LOC126990801 [Eriocheir sinensis]
MEWREEEEEEGTMDDYPYPDYQVPQEPPPRSEGAEAFRAFLEGVGQIIMEMSNRNTQQQEAPQQVAPLPASAATTPTTPYIPPVTDVHQEREVNCPICFEAFDEAHAPRTLRCGHTVCTPCLEAILGRVAGDRNCPECRRPLKVTAVAHIPVSYTILRLSRALELTSAAAAAAEAEVEESSEGTLVGEGCVLHHYPVQWWCPGCKEFQCRSCPHEDASCPERMPAKEAIIHLKQALVEEMERTELGLNELKNNFETQRDKLNLSIDHMEETIHQLGTKVDKVQQLVRRVEDTEAQVVEASSAYRMKQALAAAEKIQDAAKVWMEHKDSRPASPVVSPDEDPVYLSHLYQRLRFTKEIYAVLDGRDGVQRFGRITIESDKFIVHSFDAAPPPATALLVDEKSICFPVEHQMTAFFDIHIDGRFEGRVTIVMFRNTGFRKSRLFLDLCKNGLGKTYKDLPVHSLNYQCGDHFSKVVQIGKEIQGVSEHQPIVPRKEDDTYHHRSIYPGLVSMTMNCTPDIENSTFPTPSTFVVHLHSSKGGNDTKGFAKVLSGLGILRYAAWEKRDVVVGDCGLVVPLVDGLI